jgi:AcrR family transcriptional regulator
MSKGEVTRQRIIAAAAPLFNQRGFAGCSMHDVMEAAGLEKGGLYRHFASKDELAAEAFRHSLAEVMAARKGHEPPACGAIAKLLGHVRQFVRVPSPVTGGCPLMNTAIDADDTHPELRSLAREAIQSWNSYLSRIVEEGIRSGEIKADAQPARIANVIIATLEGALMISRLEGNRHAMLDAEATLEAMIEGLARTNASRSRKRRAPKLSAGEAFPVIN